jgi:peptidoglycan/LPS O-acetylase OafA/YrhL
MAIHSQLHPNSVTHLPYRADIDGLRAVAVIFVILFHAFPTVIKAGFIGVDIFFVISGHLISSLIFKKLSDQEFSFADFYSRRINRIFPALLMILITIFCLGWYYFIPEDFAKVTKHIFGSSIFLSNLVYLSEAGYFDDSADLKPLLHLWSLGIEEQFYIFWPLVLALGFRLKLNILTLILLCLAGSFTLNIYRASYDTNFAFFSLQTRAWELLLGAAIAFISPKMQEAAHTRKNISNIASILGACLLAAGLWLIDKGLRFPGWWALFPTLGAGLLIAAGSRAIVNRYLLSSSPLRIIGLISYPLYLWHWVLLSFATVISTQPLEPLLILVLISLSALLATGTYLLVEKPIRYSFNNKKTAFIMLLLTMGLGIVSLHGYQQRGLMGQTQQATLINDTGIYPCKVQFDNKELCVFGNRQSSEIILVYGDSHAEHLTAALAQAFGDRYKIIFAYTSSCYFGKHPSETYRRPETCEPFLKLAHHLKGQSIVATILSQRWHGYGITEPNDIRIAILDAAKALDLDPNKVILVGSTADVDLRCAKYNYYFEASRGSQICDSNARSIAINRQFIDVTSHLQVPSNVFFVYPYTKLCPSDRCQPIKNGTLLYGDAHHMTRAGAELVMSDIKNILDDRSGRSSQ